MHRRVVVRWANIIGVWNMARYNIFYSPRYQKDRERAAKRGLDISKLDEAIEFLKTGTHTDLKIGEN